MRLVTVSVTVSDQPQQLPTPAIALLAAGFVNARLQPHMWTRHCYRGPSSPILFLSLLFPKLTIVHLVNSAHSSHEQAYLRRAALLVSFLWEHRKRSNRSNCGGNNGINTNGGNYASRDASFGVGFPLCQLALLRDGLSAMLADARPRTRACAGSYCAKRARVGAIKINSTNCAGGNCTSAAQ